MSLIGYLLGRFSRWTQSKIPVLLRRTVEWDPASFILTDDPVLERVVVQTVSGAASLASTAPPAVGATGATGTGTRAARNDHTHAHGSQAGGAAHALATNATAGFMSAADKATIDGLRPPTVKAEIRSDGRHEGVSVLFHNDTAATVNVRDLTLIPHDVVAQDDAEYWTAVVALASELTSGGPPPSALTVTTQIAGGHAFAAGVGISVGDYDVPAGDTLLLLRFATETPSPTNLGFTLQGKI